MPIGMIRPMAIVARLMTPTAIADARQRLAEPVVQPLRSRRAASRTAPLALVESGA